MTTTIPWYQRLFGPSLGWGLGLPLVLLVLQIGGSTGAAHREFADTGQLPLDWFAYVLLVLGPLLLTVRQRWPVAVLLGVTVVSLTYVSLGYVYGPFIFSVIVAVVHAVKRRHRVIAWSAFLGMLVAHFALLIARGEGPADTTQLGAITGWVVVVLVSAETIRAISERREVRARVREAEEVNRITEERLRIARELHDVVAHNISLINVQAGTALHLMDRQPDQARTALSTIKQSSKDALVELRSILGVLRQADSVQPEGLEQPAPGLARLPSLLENARGAGLEVDLHTGELGTLPDRVDLAAYRILQEAITNVIRHAQASRVWISLELSGSTRPRGPDAGPAGAVSGDTSDDGAEPGGATTTEQAGAEQTAADESAVLELRVTDDGTASADEQSESAGHPGFQLGSHSGLVGMRERAEALGGSLRAGPRATSGGTPGGFEVRARLPFPVEGER